MMRRLSFVLGVGLVLAGCVSPAPYGYLVTGAVPPQIPEQLAQDTVTRMEALYPPAQTRLALTHPATDAYGVALTEALRRKGYGVMESPTTTRRNLYSRQDMPAPLPPAVSDEEGLPFRYVVDGPVEDRLYRVTVFIGDQSLSRVYQMHQHRLRQAGAWVRKQ
ncbi:MAG: conjugal transfer protein TrbH [Nitrospira sp.]|nr:conjugal transfer protein TrbH [Nitrospira sp.]